MTLRVKLEGDRDRSRSLMGDAKRFMGILKNAMSFNNLKQLSRLYKLDDGVSIFVQSVFGQDLIYIQAPISEALEQKMIVANNLLFFCPIELDIAICLDFIEKDISFRNSDKTMTLERGSSTSAFGNNDIIVSKLGKTSDGNPINILLVAQSNLSQTRHYISLPSTNDCYLGSCYYWGQTDNVGWFYPKDFKGSKEYILMGKTTKKTKDDMMVYAWGRRNSVITNDVMKSKWHKITANDPLSNPRIFDMEYTNENGVVNGGEIARNGNKLYYPIATIGTSPSDVIMHEKENNNSYDNYETTWSEELKSTLDTVRRDWIGNTCSETQRSDSETFFKKGIATSKEDIDRSLKFGSIVIETCNETSNANTEVLGSEVVGHTGDNNPSSCQGFPYVVSYTLSNSFIQKGISYEPYYSGIVIDEATTTYKAGEGYQSPYLYNNGEPLIIKKAETTSMGTYMDEYPVMDYDNNDRDKTFIIFYKDYDKTNRTGSCRDVFIPLITEHHYDIKTNWKLAYRINDGSLIKKTLATYDYAEDEFDGSGAGLGYSYKFSRSGNRLRDATSQIANGYIFYSYSIDTLKTVSEETQAKDEADNLKDTLLLEPEAASTRRIIGVIDMEKGTNKEKIYDELPDLVVPANIRSEISEGFGKIGAGNYVYRITACNPVNQTFASTSTSALTIKDSNSIQISWDKIDGATGYCVYGRKADSLGLLSYTPSTYYVDTGDKIPSGSVILDPASSTDKTQRFIGAIGFHKMSEEVLNV